MRTPTSAHTFVLPMRDAAGVGRMAAELLVNRLAARPLRVLLPTGHTPLPFYAALRELARAGRVPAGRAAVLQLDEYVGLPRGDGMSYRAYLQRELEGSGLELVDGFDVAASDLHQEAERYQRALDAQEIDLAVLGIGRNGHVAFDEPGSGPLGRARVVRLTESTRAAAAADFGGLDGVPTHAMTVGMRTLLEAREVLLLVTGEVKAEILHAALTGSPRAKVPASMLRLHPRLTVLCDRAAAVRLPHLRGLESDRAVVVLGHRDPDSRKHRVSHQSFGRLAVAAEVAKRHHVRAAVLTGFTSTGGLSEAEQMGEEWAVREVPAVLEVSGRDTNENATRSLPLVEALGGIRHVTVVTSAWHLRARRAFRPFRRAGFAVDFRFDWRHGPWLRMLARELRLMWRSR